MGIVFMSEPDRSKVAGYREVNSLRAVASTSDLDLIRRARRRDKPAFGELVSRYQQRIWKLIYRMTKDRDAAWDLAQDTFVKAYFNLETFNERYSFYPWLSTIAVNLALNYIKREKREVQFATAEEKEDLIDSRPAKSNPLAELIDREMVTYLKKEIERLPTEFKTVLILRMYEDFSYEEIARTLGISVGTVMSRLYRARQRLLAVMKQYR